MARNRAKPWWCCSPLPPWPPSPPGSWTVSAGLSLLPPGSPGPHPSSQPSSPSSLQPTLLLSKGCPRKSSGWSLSHGGLPAPPGPWEGLAGRTLLLPAWAGGEGAWLAVCTRQEFGGRMHLETLHASTNRAILCRESPGWQRRGSSSCSSPPRFRYGEGAGRTS